jgi:hypothetical protein
MNVRQVIGGALIAGAVLMGGAGIAAADDGVSAPVDCVSAPEYVIADGGHCPPDDSPSMDAPSVRDAWKTKQRIGGARHPMAKIRKSITHPGRW